MITTKKELKEYLNYEKTLYGFKSTSHLVPRISDAGKIWKYVILLRKEEYYSNKHRKIAKTIIKLKRKRLGLKLGFQIPINVIDKGLLIYHYGNIVINAKHIGENCSIAGTLFMVAKGQTGDNPEIGNNVSFGMNVTVVGGVKLADGIAVGAGSVITKSFLEENATIAGNPAKIINKDGGSKTWGGWINHFGKK